jgi:hypothetical protein
MNVMNVNYLYAGGDIKDVVNVRLFGKRNPAMDSRSSDTVVVIVSSRAFQ